MNISARNVFRGTVRALRPGAIHAELMLELEGGEPLVALVTMESCRELGLAPGRPALALVEARWVMVMAGAGGSGLSARNVLRGRVKAVTAGPVNVRVLLESQGGTEVEAVITREAAQELGLAPGVPATAVIEASQVVLAVRERDAQEG
ncbi:TOBE domain-containing protein [Caldimonas tepidiphila]|uniref:TOBE domain-containing protein n=1 Tax=Caldimonas tepidiphila TaxID=2315841 RepID=UPI000E5B4D7C|nr:TOBE domain-containing protein [Caldimonas tepidiphila]